MITNEESTLVRAVVRDAAGCCMVNQTVEFSVDQGLFPDRLLPSQRRAGEYVATFFGSEYSGPIPGTVRIGLEVNGEIGPIVQLQIEPTAGGSTSLTGSSGNSGSPEPEPSPEPECTPSEAAGPAGPAQMVLQADKTKLASGESAEILVVLRDAEGHCTESSTARLGVLASGNQLVGGVQLVQQGNGRYRGVFSFVASWAEMPRVGLVVIVDSATMSDQVLMIEQA